MMYLSAESKTGARLYEFLKVFDKKNWLNSANGMYENKKNKKQ